MRHATGSTAPFNLTIQTTEVDAYWAYWLDGAGDNVRLRLNLPRASFTKVAARQFALHEVLGHGLQGASWSARAAGEPRRHRPTHQDDRRAHHRWPRHLRTPGQPGNDPTR